MQLKRTVHKKLNKNDVFRNRLKEEGWDGVKRKCSMAVGC